MATTTEIARRYFEAIDAHDLDAAVDCWEPGGIDRFVGEDELIAPWGIRRYFGALFDAFPDFSIEILDVTAARSRAAVRWRGRGTFAGPGYFQGFAPNGARVELEGCDVVTVGGEKIQRNDAYLNSGDIARQLGFLPPAGSAAEQRLTAVANRRTKLVSRMHTTDAQRIADGVWIVRGGFPMKTMNVYLIEDDGGVTVFDAGIKDMARGVLAAAVRLGGVKRVVLGHADADHRGAAPALQAPVYCHPDDRAAAESESSFRDYWNFSKLRPHGRFFYSRILSFWDGGAVPIAGTVQEGDEIAGFKVVHLPGHAPGMIGLFREADRFALVSDCFYTLNVQTGLKGPARVPHPAFNRDTDQARASIRKLAELSPSIAWGGHVEPVRGDVVAELQRAASAVV